MLIRRPSLYAYVTIFCLVVTPSAATAQFVDNLEKYAACKLGEKITIEESSERDQPFSRSVDTPNGLKAVEILHGLSLHIAYEGTPFVNFKAERMSNDTYERDKQTLIESLAYTAANTPGMESNQPQRATSKGFEVYSINRRELAGGVLSIYLLSRDIDHTVVTLYVLNAPTENPKFRTVADYRKLRDEFLDSYTGCVSKNLER